MKLVTRSDRDLVDAIVVVAELRRCGVVDVLIVHDQSALIAHDPDFPVFHRGETVGDHRKAGDSERHRSQDVAVVKRHLQAFVEILVMHVVDAVHGMDVGLCQPFHGDVEFRHDIIVIEDIAGNGQALRRHLVAGDLVAAAIDGVEQRLCEIDAGAEELHLLAEPHGGNTAGDAIIIARERPHQIVVLVLQRGRVLADLDAVALEGGWHVLGPQHRDVRLGRRTEIVERVQHPETALRHQRASVQIHAADAFGRPVGIAAEQRIIVRRAQEADDPELLHQLVPELLRPRFVQHARFQIALDVDIQETRDAADRHRRAIGFLDRAEIGKIGPLERLLRIGGGLGYVLVVKLRHRGEVLERPHLLGQFLPHPDDLVGRPHVVDLGPFRALDFEQPIHPVERDPPVVADDASAAVGIRKAGDDAGPSAAHDLRRIGVKHAVIVRLAVFRESLVHRRIGLKPRRLEAVLDHPQASVREDRPLEGLVGLKAHDDLVLVIDIASRVREQCRGVFSVDCKHSLLPLVREVGLQFGPDSHRALRGSGQKVLVPGVRRDIPDDEIADIDGSRPVPGPKAIPAIARISFLP